MTSVTRFHAALIAARESCAAARAAKVLGSVSGGDAASVSIAARDAVKTCDDALAAGRAAMRTLGSDGNVTAAMERLTAAEAEAESTRKIADELSSRVSGSAGPLAHRVLQAQARLAIIGDPETGRHGMTDGALAEARRTLAAATARFERASDMRSFAKPWEPTAGEAEAARGYVEETEKHGRLAASAAALSPEARDHAATHGVPVVAGETYFPSAPSLAAHGAGIFEKMARFAEARERARQEVADAEARVAELTEAARVAASFRAQRIKDRAVEERRLAEARAAMREAVEASGASCEELARARARADEAASRHQDAARALIRARQAAATGSHAPHGGVTAHLPELERLRQQAAVMLAPRAVVKL